MLSSELSYYLIYFFFFFFQAEDGIRDLTVTGVQTCALPIAGGWREAAERGLERTRFRAQELDEHRAVLRPQLTRRDQRRARVQVPLPAAGAKLREQRGVLAPLRPAGPEAPAAARAGPPPRR